MKSHKDMSATRGDISITLIKIGDKNTVNKKIGIISIEDVDIIGNDNRLFSLEGVSGHRGTNGCTHTSGS